MMSVQLKAMRERSDSFTDAPIEPGTLVRYDGLTDGGPEFGVVVSCWHNPEVRFHDCYVAFFGAEIPKGEPERKPYILRYASVSLARLELAKNDRYTRGQKLILAIGLPFGLTILAVNISSALGASESIKDNIAFAGMFVFLIGLGWATWTWVRKPRR